MRVIAQSVVAGAVLLVLSHGALAYDFDGTRSGEYLVGDPPDVQLAAGPNHLVELVNSRMRVFLKNPLGEMASTVDLGTLLGCPGPFDPRVRYDAQAQRWYISAARFGSQDSRVCFAVSRTPDPTGPFIQYQFVIDPTVFPDFDTLGYNDDKVIVEFNRVPVEGASPPIAQTGVELWILNKADLLAGGPVRSQSVFPGTFVMPATTLSSNTTLYLENLEETRIVLMSVTGVPGVGGGAVVTTLPTLPFSANFVAPSSPQKNSDNLLYTVGSIRDVVYRNGKMWASATSACTPSGDTQTRCCLRLVELNDNGAGSFSIAQDIEYSQANTYYFYPAIGVDATDALVVGFGASSSTIYPSFYATGRKATEPVNTLHGPTRVAAGQAPYGVNCLLFGMPLCRWGDYFGAAVDPVDSHTIWIAGEYAAYPTPTWSTRIEQVSTN